MQRIFKKKKKKKRRDVNGEVIAVVIDFRNKARNPPGVLEQLD